MALLALIAGVALYFSRLQTYSLWVMGAVALEECLPLIKLSWTELRHGSYGIDLLVLSAIITAVILRQDFAAITLAIMITVSESLKRYAATKARGEIDALLAKAPNKAHVMRGRKTLELTAGDVKLNDKFIVKAGEIVPVDAVIIEGMSSFDESYLTGQSVPTLRVVGEQILSGSLNSDSTVTARAIHTAHDSQYQQSVSLLESASLSQSPFIKLANRYSIPFAIIAYIVGATAWILSHQAIRFLDVIIVATTGPLLLSSPIALKSGLSRASKYGIIVKSGSVFEKLAETKTFIFDKTGVLTTGKLILGEVEAFNPYSKDEILALAASIEQYSPHAIAKAIINGAVVKKIKLAKVKDIKENKGLGIKANFKGDRLILGRYNFLSNNGVVMPAGKTTTPQAATIIYLAINETLAGTIQLNDPPRINAKSTLQTIRRLGVTNTVMLTGDSQDSANTIAKAVGIKTIYAETLPGEKLHALDDIKPKPVVFVGDGLSDAPILTASDVGIVLGARGSTSVCETANLIIMADDISKVATALEIAKKTFSVATLSIIIGLGLSLVLMGVFATGMINAIYGALLHALIDISVIIYALRARTIQLRGEIKTKP